MTDRAPSPPQLDAIQACVDVSRETVDRFQILVDHLIRWQARINLVGPATLEDVWSRHVIDSAQLWPLIPNDAKRLTDFGSGGGFPGLVLAAMAAETGSPHIDLVESDHRKAAFLRTCAHAMTLSVGVHVARAEQIDPWPCDVITARAFAPLNRLFGFTARFATADTTWLLPKGRQADQELTEAREYWTFQVQRIPSRTDPSSQILVIQDVAQRNA